jgi:hypothetical protein
MPHAAPYPFQRNRRRALRAAAALAALLALGALGAACDGEDATTGKRVQHRTIATAGEEAAGAFTNAYGWSITLSRAYISIGSLYYFDGAPVTARLDAPGGRRPSRAEQVLRWVIPEAHAHPGHYQQGNALGEMTAPATVDLVAGPAEMGPSASVTGLYRSALFTFGVPPAGPLAAELGAAVVLIEGSAQSGAEERLFRAEAAPADVFDTTGAPIVAGCVFEEADVQADGIVTVLVKPSVWLDQVDFMEVPASADGAPVPLDPAGTPHKAFVRGLKKGTAYLFSYATTAQE